jgi:hypothetical protein
MSRILKLRTPLLALVFSIAAEVLFFGLALLASMASPHNPVLAWRLFVWFHAPPEWLVLSFMQAFKPFHDIQSMQAQITSTFMLLTVALLQWYVILLATISLFRRFSRRPE